MKKLGEILFELFYGTFMLFLLFVVPALMTYLVELKII